MQKQKDDTFRVLLPFYLILAVVLGIAFWGYVSSPADIEEIPYSQFHMMLIKGEVSDLVIGDTVISGKYRTTKGKPAVDFTTLRVDPGLAQDLDKHDVKYSGAPQNKLFDTILGWVVPLLLFFGLWMFLLRPTMGGSAGGLMAVGRSRAKIYAEEGTKVTFADVAGVDEAKQELAEVVGFLKNPQVYGRLGARIPKGVLLVGPPGTGKTLLARAVAGEAGVPFFSITGSEFVEMFVGVGAARVRDLFTQARTNPPAIVFIDELDALGRARGIDMPMGGHDEKEQTLNQLLAEMDGFDPSAGIIVLAATNRPEILDPALLRAGRFDRQVLVDRPDKKGRAEILAVHLKKIRTAPDLDITTIAGLTPGFTGADLANLVNEAALVATRRGAETTTLDDFTQAIERVVAGLEKKSRILSAHERAIVAHHEMGHALVSLSLPGMDPVQKVSIIPRGISALGYTLQRPTEDRFIMTETELFNRTVVLLGGRAAEAIVFSEISTGAADDLARATDIARNMVVRFGMTRALGQVAYEPETGAFLGGQIPQWRPRLYADKTAESIDRAVKDLVDKAFETARAILERNRTVLNEAAKELLAHETLNQAQLAKFAEALQPGPQAKPSLSVVS